MTKNNPWLNITDGKERIATIDIPFFEKWGSAAEYANIINGKNKETELTFHCLPEPFSGNPDSKVYCLNMNPGKPDLCFDEEINFIEATKTNLQLKSQSCFWAEKIRNKCGKEHAGVDWLRKRTNKLEDIIGGHPDLFFIEYFPYHSSKGFDFPKNLPSYEFSNELIKKIIGKDKLIIIMREKKNWLNRVKELASHPNLYILKCCQGGYLTPNNIVRYSDGKSLSDDEIIKYFLKK